MGDPPTERRTRATASTASKKMHVLMHVQILDKTAGQEDHNWQTAGLGLLSS